MSKHKRGRITVQHQPTGVERGMIKMMGAVHAVFGFVFAAIALTAIIPEAGLVGLPFLIVGAFFCLNGIRLVVSKNDIAHRVGYDVETDCEEETILGLMDEAKPEPETHDHISSIGPSAQSRLEQLESLKKAGLISDKEYKEKRQQILQNL